MRAILLAFLLTVSTLPAMAVQPDELLTDPVLESRARAISQGLRCPVCQNENIDDSDSTIAGDLRVLLRERLVAGDTDREAVDFIVARYGEFVLLRPDGSGMNLVLWLAGPAMLVAGLALAATVLRRNSSAVPPAPDLTEEDRARLEEILKR